MGDHHCLITNQTNVFVSPRDPIGRTVPPVQNNDENLSTAPGPSCLFPPKAQNTVQPLNTADVMEAPAPSLSHQLQVPMESDFTMLPAPAGSTLNPRASCFEPPYISQPSTAKGKKKSTNQNLQKSQLEFDFEF